MVVCMLSKGMSTGPSSHAKDGDSSFCHSEGFYPLERADDALTAEESTENSAVDNEVRTLP